MRYLLTRLGSFAGLLAISGAALAQTTDFDAAVNLPEPGVLGLTAIAAVIGLVIARKRRRK